MQEGEESELMMPHCIKMMMPAISKDRRAELASKLVGTVVEQASSGMSGQEKASFVSKIVESVLVATNKPEHECSAG